MRPIKLSAKDGGASAVWGLAQFPGLVVGKSVARDPKTGSPILGTTARWRAWIDLSAQAADSGIWAPGEIQEAKRWFWTLEEYPEESDCIKRFEKGWQIVNQLDGQRFQNRDHLLETIYRLAETEAGS